MTPACREVNLRFKEAEPTVSEGLIKYKFRVANAYWGKVKDDRMFPKGAGVTQKGVKLGRIGTTMDHGWERVKDNYCETNMCKTHAPEVINNGHETYQYSLMKKAIRSDWFCINSLVLREISDQEIAHFEEGLRKAALYHWDEVYRSRYIDQSDNKMVPILPDSISINGDTCDIYVKGCNPTFKTDGFVWEARVNADGSAGELDERYIRVNVHPDKINRISELTLDMLDEAAIMLSYEDDNMPALSEGIELFDVVLADYRMVNRFMRQEDVEMNGAMSYGGYDAQKLKKSLGTKGVLRDRYSVRYDKMAAKFYPDGVANAAMVEEDGYAYDPLDPQTWPRFQRVFAFIPKMIPSQEGVGIKYVVNPNYLYAPFGISNIFSPLVMEGLNFPDLAGVGSARKESPGTKLGYQGKATWINPDWECNEDREMGFWKLRFGIGIRPWMTEFGYSYFHRIDQRISFQPNCCPIPNAPCVEEVSPYCYQGMTGEYEDLNGTMGANVVQATGPWC